jgi:hypothetical protein
MVTSAAPTVDQYLAELPEDRRAVLDAVRELVLANLPDGYEETMTYGMPTYVIPLSRYPVTYNKQPLGYVAFAAQKGNYALYLSTYQDPEHDAWFRGEFAKAGKKLDMGKSCLRFKRLDDLPLDAIATSIAKVTPEQLIARYEASRAK